MDGDAKRGIAAYTKTKSLESEALDWLSEVAASDTDENLNNESSARTNEKQPAKTNFVEPFKIPAFAKIPRKNRSNRKKSTDSKFTRVAKFLILIGSDQAANVLANLGEDQVEQISKEIALVRGIDADEASDILGEFEDLLSGGYNYAGAAQGGEDEARRLLYAAFGPEKGEVYFRRSIPAADETTFSFLEDFSGEQVATLLHDESPSIAALILSRISPALSAGVLKFSADEWRKETIRRIGRLGRVSPEVLGKVAESLREKARRIGSSETTNMDGMGALAAILKHADISFGDKILGELSETDADLSSGIKERLFTLADVVKAENRPIQEKMHNMSIKDIAILLKGRPEDFKEKLLSNMSSNRRAEVMAETSLIGPITKKDSEAAIKGFMEWFRAAREDGTILIEEDDLVM
jgi:flagellar motor switch protein FliG